MDVGVEVGNYHWYYYHYYYHYHYYYYYWWSTKGQGMEGRMDGWEDTVSAH